MGNVWADIFIWNSTYGYISKDRFTGAIHPTWGHGDKAGCASCFPGEGPQTTWHQSPPRGVWVSSSLFSIGDRGGIQALNGCRSLGGCGTLPVLRNSVRAAINVGHWGCWPSGRDWKLLSFITHLALPVSLAPKGTGSFNLCKPADSQAVPWMTVLAVGISGRVLGHVPSFFTDSFCHPQFPAWRLLS